MRERIQGVVGVEMNSSPHKNVSDTAPLNLPKEFANTIRHRELAADATWEETRITASALNVRIAYPKGWLSVSGIPGVTMTLSSPDGAFLAMLAPPIPAPMQLTKPGTFADLQAYAEALSGKFGGRTGRVGQARIAGRLWVWLDLGDGLVSAVNPSVPNPSSAASPIGNRVWIFTSSAGQHQVTLMFMILHGSGSTRDGWDAQAAQAGPMFAQILARIGLEP